MSEFPLLGLDPSVSPPRYCDGHGTEPFEPCDGCAGTLKVLADWLAKQSHECRIEAQRMGWAVTHGLQADGVDPSAAVRAVDAEARHAAAVLRSACRLCDEDGYRLPAKTIVCDHVDRRQTAARGAARVREAMAARELPLDRGPAQMPPSVPIEDAKARARRLLEERRNRLST